MDDKETNLKMAAPAAPSKPKKPDETSAFKQQRLAAWQPVMSPPYVIGCFIFTAVVFIPIGVAVIVASDSIVEVVQRYDNLPGGNCFDPSCNNNVTFTINVPRKMTAPVFMYYGLLNFYQNHRRYAMSSSAPQLSGDLAAALTGCSPFTTPGEYIPIPGNQTVVTINSYPGGPTSQITVDITTVDYLPCGLVAWSKFNDTFILFQGTDTTNTTNLICHGGNFDVNGNIINPNLPTFCQKSGIAWPSDIGNLYAQPPPAFSGTSAPSYYGYGGWPGVVVPSGPQQFCLEECIQQGYYIGEWGHPVPSTMDEDLMVWMRISSIANFRKLYRRINVDIEPGTYTVIAENFFPVASFSGQKSFVITTTAWIGGPNYILGGLYIATGLTSLILGIAFAAKYFATPQRISL